MARPSNSVRGKHAKQNYQVPAGTSYGIIFDSYGSGASALVTADSTGLVVAGKIKVSGKKYIGANSTGFIFTAAATKPATRSSSKWAFITNSTGVNGIAINTTGTTWKYLNVTSAIPT